jgi:hypothetical protein
MAKYDRTFILVLILGISIFTMYLIKKSLDKTDILLDRIDYCGVYFDKSVHSVSLQESTVIKHKGVKRARIIIECELENRRIK